jgi:tRNA threonylcarbamoyladenosine biosynthesis protein TsaE
MKAEFVPGKHARCDPIGLDSADSRGPRPRPPALAGRPLRRSRPLGYNPSGMTDSAAPLPVRSLFLPDEAATERLGARLAAALAPRDLVALSGDLGTGKTCLARAVIAGLMGGPEEVPSPTFTLVQTYETPRGPLWHFDLYRLSAPDEVWELGFEEALAEGISLIEWPERLGRLLPAVRLDLGLRFAAEPGARHADLVGHGAAWAGRLDRIAA